tara:strand:- start:520 stop:1182 length:663 start_codon:yes stop_codon:yes gene_type:complete
MKFPSGAGCSAEIDDDFTSNNFTDRGSGFGVDITEERCDWIAFRGNSVNGTFIALPSELGADSFLVQFTLVISAFSATTGNEKYFWVGLSSSNSCNSTTSQNNLAMYFHNYSGEANLRLQSDDNGTFQGGVLSTVQASAFTKYIRIYYDSTATTTAKLEIYSNSDFSDTPVTATDTSYDTSLRYTNFVMMGMKHASAGAGSATGYIKDLKIFNDRITPCP